MIVHSPFGILRLQYEALVYSGMDMFIIYFLNLNFYNYVHCLFQFKPIQAEFYEHYYAYALSPLTASPSYLIKHIIIFSLLLSYSLNHIPSEETLRLTVIRSNVYVQL